MTITNQRLRAIIRSAYGSNDLDVIGGPDWIDSHVRMRAAERCAGGTAVRELFEFQDRKISFAASTVDLQHLLRELRKSTSTG